MAGSSSDAEHRSQRRIVNGITITNHSDHFRECFEQGPSAPRYR